MNKIKKLTLIINEIKDKNNIINDEDENDIINDEDENNIYFFKTLFSFNNIDNNLIYLKILLDFIEHISLQNYLKI